MSAPNDQLPYNPAYPTAQAPQVLQALQAYPTQALHGQYPAAPAAALLRDIRLHIPWSTIHRILRRWLRRIFLPIMRLTLRHLDLSIDRSSRLLRRTLLPELRLRALATLRSNTTIQPEWSLDPVTILMSNVPFVVPLTVIVASLLWYLH
ncbi:hypothetical protein L596_021316 [Steinernema carpocapsae]|uniref:Uncharacterized protein n=1 Tax=Steinernema carpocapsae TaxID=34508 RepID=A0A4U5MIA7_STECR|nr:hypothetical protein L596_021316 [Steinernema carpocapsae]